MKLEERYIRTYDGFIRKIKVVSKENAPLVLCVINNKPYTINDIQKASFNVIDLIEENDYIRIITSSKFEHVYSSYGKLVIKDDIDISNYSNKFVAEIITHEQMEQISYKLGE